MNIPQQFTPEETQVLNILRGLKPEHSFAFKWGPLYDAALHLEKRGVIEFATRVGMGDFFRMRQSV